MLFKKEDMFVVDPKDQDGMVKLMDRYEEYPSAMFGFNEIGEEIHIAVFQDAVCTRTFQHNGWVRDNFYHRDGTHEELYDGKWKEEEYAKA